MNKLFGFLKNKNFLLGIGFLIFCSGLIYSIFLITHRHWLFSLTPTDGAIGDAINGITAPVIGILGAILIYASFVQQIRANKLLSAQNEFNLLISLLNELKKDIQVLYDNAKWGKPKGVKPQPLSDISTGGKIPAAFGRQMIFVLQSYQYIYQRIEKLHLNKDDMLLLYQQLQSQYENYLEVYCKHFAKFGTSTDDMTEIRKNIITLSINLEDISIKIEELKVELTKSLN